MADDDDGSVSGRPFLSARSTMSAMACPVIKEGRVTKGDALDLLACLPDGSVDLVVTSPPYASMRRDHYNSIEPDEYPGWFLPISKEIQRAVKPSGSFVLNVKENVVDGSRHPYVMKTVLGMLDQGWKLSDTYVWHKTNPYPLKSKRRLKDGWEYAYHFVKNPADFKFFPDNVKVPVKKSACVRMKSVKSNDETFGTGSAKYTRMMAGDDCESRTVYPSNVLDIGVGANRGAYHPARFPPKLPAFFINLLTEAGDTIIDPFAGSGTTIAEAKKSCRKGIGFDMERKYVDSANADLEKVEAKSC